MPVLDAGVDVRSPASAAELRSISVLLAEVWGVEPAASPGPINVLSALLDTGGYVAGAWDTADGQLVGASFGFVYLDSGRAGLRSQVTATTRPRRGIGRALKMDQRRWAHAAGIETISWTFDPLLTRNGRFNLMTLGAHITRFRRDFYGVLDDAVNGQSETDRCVVEWSTSASRPVPPFDHRVTSAQLEAQGHVVVVTADGYLRDVDRPRAGDHGASALLIASPPDVTAMRRRADPALRLWSSSFRGAWSDALARGFVGDGVTSDGFYRLRRPAPTT